MAGVAAEYSVALADPLRQSIGKFWAQTAFDNGVDLTDRRALDRFRRDLDAGRVRYDADLLDKLVEVRFRAAEVEEERAFADGWRTARASEVERSRRGR